MNSYVFFGKILPVSDPISLKTNQPIRVKQLDTNLDFTISFVAHQSNLVVDIKSEKQISDLVTLKNYIYNTVSLYIDCIGLNKNAGYVVQIDSAKDLQTNDTLFFNNNFPFKEDEDIEIDWKEVIKVIEQKTNDPAAQYALQRSLSEFRKAIVENHDTGFHSYRCIESIRQYFTKGWPQMRSALNINKSYLSEFKDYADEQRHGGTKYMTEEVRAGMILKSKNVIRRFVNYLLDEESNANLPNLFSMHLRPYNPKDKQQVTDIFNTHWNDTSFVGRLLEKLDMVVAGDNPQDFHFYVAEDAEEIVGVAAFRNAPDHMAQYAQTEKPAEFYILGVKYKGRGIGEALRTKRLEEAKSLGYTEVVLYSPDTHNASWGFHDRLGFERVGAAVAPDGEPGMIWRKLL